MGIPHRSLKLAQKSGAVWHPKTAVGRKLLKLREQFLAQGGEVLDPDGIAKELRERRGGIRAPHFIKK